MMAMLLPDAFNNAKRQSINLKVFIHCDGCTKKVKKVLNHIEGVESVVVDAGLGKVTVLGAVDSKVLIKKLKKAGKRAELWTPNSTNGKTQTQTQTQTQIPTPIPLTQPQQQQFMKELREAKDAKAMSNLLDSLNNTTNTNNNTHRNSNPNPNPNPTHKDSTPSPNKPTNNNAMAAMMMVRPAVEAKNSNTMAPSPLVHFATDSADYPTTLFSDENAHNCSIM